MLILFIRLACLSCMLCGVCDINQMSAQESRRKKKDYVDGLEKQYVKLSRNLFLTVYNWSDV